MQIDYPIDKAPAAPEYVLDVLRDDYRQQCECDPEAIPGVELSMNTTIAEWRDACDLAGWRRVAEFLNRRFGVTYSLDLWRDFLEPEHETTLKGICLLVAKRAVRRKVRPSKLLGSSCMTAGVFRTIKAMLRTLGADVSHLRPSTELHEYARSYPELFLTDVSDLSSGKLPAATIRYCALCEAALRSFGLSLLAVIGGGALKMPYLSLIGAVVAIMSYPTMWITARHVKPTSVTFGDLRTFADLSRKLAGAV